jgi:uncharacterized phage-associated protein
MESAGGNTYISKNIYIQDFHGKLLSEKIKAWKYCSRTPVRFIFSNTLF